MVSGLPAGNSSPCPPPDGSIAANPGRFPDGDCPDLPVDNDPKGPGLPRVANGLWQNLK